MPKHPRTEPAGACLRNRNGRQHEKQENRRSRRQRKARQRAEEWAGASDEDRAAYAAQCRENYMHAHGQDVQIMTEAQILEAAK